MPVDEVTLAPNLEAVLFTPAVGKRGRHVDAFQTYHDFYKDELHIPQRRFDAGRLPTAITRQKIALCSWFAYRARRAGDSALRRREALLVDFAISGTAPALYQPFA